MGIVYNASTYLDAQTGNPVTFDYTTTGEPGVILIGIHAVKQQRTGGVGTFGGRPFSVINQISFDHGEAAGELWYLLDPSSGTYTISMPNTPPSSTLYINIISFNHDSGYDVSFDASIWQTAATANPSATINASTGGLVVQFASSASNTLPTAYTDTVNNANDHGNNVSWLQYKENPTNGNNTMGATLGAATFVLVTASFKEYLLPVGVDIIKSIGNVGYASIKSLGNVGYSSIKSIGNTGRTS